MSGTALPEAKFRFGFVTAYLVLFTGVTQWAYKSDMYSHKDSLRLRQHGILLSFSQKCCTMCNISVKKTESSTLPEAKFRFGFVTA